MILVVGVGNPLRRDDRAGWDAATLLGELLIAHGLDAQVILTQQLAPELAVEVSNPGVTMVCFVDVSVIACAASLRRIVPPPSQHGNMPVGLAEITHQVAPESVLAYASLLCSEAPPAWMIEMPGTDFDHGEGLSETASSALETLPGLATALAEIAAIA